MDDRRHVAAVAYGHKNGIVHRDIKPANIVLSDRHEPVLTDFDIADIKFVTSLSTVVEGGLGTPVFAAPEQLLDGEASDERSDVYSLGRVFHFLLLEQSPGLELGKEPELRNLRDFPPGIVEVVRRATQPVPSRRFVNVTQMLDALERSLTGTAARAARLGDLRRWIVRNLRLLLAMLIVTGGAIGFGVYERSRAHREQILRNEARAQEARAVAAAQELADAGKELARLTQQVRDFQASATTLVSRRDDLVSSIATLKSAISGSRVSTKDREHFNEQLTKDQEELDRVNARIADNQAQQRRLQDEVVAAEARVKRQVSAGTPPSQDSSNSPAQPPNATSQFVSLQPTSEAATAVQTEQSPSQDPCDLRIMHALAEAEQQYSAGNAPAALSKALDVSNCLPSVVQCEKVTRYACDARDERRAKYYFIGVSHALNPDLVNDLVRECRKNGISLSEELNEGEKVKSDRYCNEGSHTWEKVCYVGGLCTFDIAPDARHSLPYCDELDLPPP